MSLLTDAKKLMKIADKYAFFIPGSAESEDARKELEDAISGFESAVLAKLAGMELPEWSKRDDLGGLVPSEIRQAFRQAFAQGAASQLSAEPFTHYRHYDEQVQPFAAEGTVPLFTRKEPS